MRVVVLEKLAQPAGLSKVLPLQARSMGMLAYCGMLDRFTAANPTLPAARRSSASVVAKGKRNRNANARYAAS